MPPTAAPTPLESELPTASPSLFDVHSVDKSMLFGPPEKLLLENPPSSKIQVKPSRGTEFTDPCIDEFDEIIPRKIGNLPTPPGSTGSHCSEVPSEVAIVIERSTYPLHKSQSYPKTSKNKLKDPCTAEDATQDGEQKVTNPDCVTRDEKKEEAGPISKKAGKPCATRTCQACACPIGYRPKKTRSLTWMELIEYMQADGGWAYPENTSGEEDENSHHRNCKNHPRNQKDGKDEPK